MRRKPIEIINSEWYLTFLNSFCFMTNLKSTGIKINLQHHNIIIVT